MAPIQCQFVKFLTATFFRYNSKPLFCPPYRRFQRTKHSVSKIVTPKYVLYLLYRVQRSRICWKNDSNTFGRISSLLPLWNDAPSILITWNLYGCVLHTCLRKQLILSISIFSLVRRSISPSHGLNAAKLQYPRKINHWPAG